MMVLTLLILALIPRTSASVGTMVHSVVLSDERGAVHSIIPDVLGINNSNNFLIAAVGGSGTRAWYQIIIKNSPMVNNPPMVSNENPMNASLHVSVYLSEISFTVSDPEDDAVAYTVTASPDFIGGPHSGTAVTNTTIHILRRNGMLANDTTYVWWVNATDGMVWTNDTFSFTTVSEIFDGYTLFTPMDPDNSSTFLIDNNGKKVHTWFTNCSPSNGVYMVENGSILRPYVIFDGEWPELTRGVQKITWNGTVVWNFSYSSEDYWQTHDIAPLPNGNVLILALERKNYTEAIAAGRNPALLNDSELWSVYVVEVKQTGPTNGTIVWEWHLWDHLIQDYNSTKANYGNVTNNPELLDINFAVNGHDDWIHPNTVSYNPELDQVMICSRLLGEFWIIDHSTTTEEAASHTGGIHSRGGDFLYRWGNPQIYRAGNVSDQKLFGAHDPQWIQPGCPGEGNILIFNNGWSRPEGSYSSVDEITPPIDAQGNYSLAPGAAYGPENLTWQYEAADPYSFYASFISGCQRLPNGNTLICNGPSGFFFEVTNEGKIVWSYNNTDPYPGCNVFRACRYYSPFYPPILPSITGPNSGTVGMQYNYTFVTTDPDGDNVYYAIDWGDNTSVNWIGPYKSGEEMTINHTWVVENNYIIKCEAKNPYDSMSNWSTLTTNVGTPYSPSNPSPANGTTSIDINANLGWTGGDPDAGDTVTYDVYFGTSSSPPKVVANQSALSYDPGTMGYLTRYYWKIVAWDNHGASTGGPLWHFTTTSSSGGGGSGGGSQNKPPIADPKGPYYGVVNTSIQFTGTGSYDPDGFIVQYDWQFFSGDTWHDNISATPTHTYNAPGIYTVTLRVHDDSASTATATTIVTVNTSNHLPSTPTITGPTTGNVNTNYSYTVNAIEPGNNTIRYVIDWGDGTKTTSTFSASGTSYIASHKWAISGVYTIKVNTEDNNNGISGTTTLQVTIGAPNIPQINGSLIDTNGDGILDSFHNNTTGKNVKAQRLANGAYLVDINGDGKWDYYYDPTLGTYTPYSAASAGPNWLLWGGLAVIVVIIIGGLVLFMRRRKT